jgi:hypothetical protein
MADRRVGLAMLIRTSHELDDGCLIRLNAPNEFRSQQLVHFPLPLGTT